MKLTLLKRNNQDTNTFRFSALNKKKNLYYIKFFQTKGKSFHEGKSSMSIDAAAADDKHAGSFSVQIVKGIILMLLQEIVPDPVDDDALVVQLLTTVPFIKETLKRLIKEMPEQIRDRAINEVGESIRDYLFDLIDESNLDQTRENVSRHLVLAKKKAREKLMDPDILDKYPNF